MTRADLAGAISELDHRSPIPLYYQLASWLIREIECGSYPANTVLAPEPEIAQAVGVSRNTVRSALAILQHRNMIDRRRGIPAMVVDASEPERRAVE